MLDQLNNDGDHKASEQAKMGASCVKILLKETIEAEKIEKEKWRSRKVINCFR